MISVLRMTLAAGCAALFLVGGATAADYPSKSITLISPKEAGGAADLAARAFATIAERYIGQSIRVVNKPGGAGVPGTIEVRESRPDGYTLTATLSAMMLTAPIFKAQNPYQTSDFTFISILEDQPITFAVRKDSPYDDVQSLLEAMKSADAPMRVAVASKIGLATLAYNGLVQDLGLDESTAQPVPYKNGPAAARGLLAGDVDFASINLASISAALASGDAKLLMVTTTKRNDKFPDVPTALEAGLPTVDGMALWTGLVGPKDLPDEVLAKWADVLPQVFADPDYAEMLSRRGAGIVGTLPDQTGDIVAGQVANFEALKAALGN
ncbi:MAG: tripartite tricarboxylate transporter substrate binding protein [Proteobacteria bacterium]|nr:tripartite tricarboxylate transporter substrate binding protein [Pseudomonadota bacterium]